MSKGFLIAGAVVAIVGALPMAWGQPASQPVDRSAGAGGQPFSTQFTPGVEGAIDRGLAYLAKAQRQDGSWESRHPIADTSLALMAFMLQGHVPGEGRYGPVMDKSIAYLLDRAEQNRGYMAMPTTKGGMYEHGLAVIALSEAWGQSTNPKIRQAVKRGVEIMLGAQSDLGGWRYQPEPTGADISVSSMVIVALSAAKEAGIAVPDHVLARGAKYIMECNDKPTGGFRYQPKHSDDPNVARTGCGALSVAMCGGRGSVVFRRALDFLEIYPAQRKFAADVDYYAHYYAMQAMYQGGDDHFGRWYPNVANVMLRAQLPDGSWKWVEGQPIATGFAVLTLGVPYRFLPIYQR